MSTVAERAGRPESREKNVRGVRPEIQALRAIAVLAVVIYHLWPSAVPGGYVGVDIFFVISGFLITAHLVRESRQRGRIHLGAFWARRARRLLPASFLVILVSLAGTLAFAPQNLWQQYLREMGASVLYVLNWALAGDAVDYLAAENTASPVQHYWSLSVEEQFYLLWPLLIMLALWLASRSWSMRSRTALLVALGAVAAASFITSIVLTETVPSAAYFVTPTRAWEFAAGGLLAVALGRRSGSAEPTGSRSLAVLSWLGLAAIGTSLALFSSATPFPGTAALLPVLGTVAVIGAGTSSVRWSPTGLMSWRPVGWLGDISYSLYLWHWPLIVLVPFAVGRELDDLGLGLLLVASVALAWATKRFVEDPARTAPLLVSRRPRVTLLATAACMAVIVGGSSVGWFALERQVQTAVAETQKLTVTHPSCFGAAALAPGAPDPCINERLEGRIFPDRNAGQRDGVIPDGMKCRAASTLGEHPVCHFGDTTDPALTVALVGDSHAEHWVPALDELGKERHWRIDTYLKGGCPFSAALRDDGEKGAAASCAKFNARVLDTLEESSYDIIVTSQASGNSFVSKKGESDLEASTRGLVKTWTTVAKRTDAKLIAIRDNPLMTVQPVTCLSSLGDEAAERSDECTSPRSEAVLDDAQVDAGRKTGVPVVDLTDFFCSETTCFTVIGNVTVYRDNGHIGGTYSQSLGTYLGTAIDEIIAD